MKGIQQKNNRKIYSKSLKTIVAMKYVRGEIEDKPMKLLKTERSQEVQKRKENLRKSINKMLFNKKQYDHQIDNVVKDLVEKEKMKIQLPNLRRKSSYHNYRIETARLQTKGQVQNDEEESEVWRKQHLPQLQQQKRNKTQPRQYELSKQRDNIYQVVKHYRLSSLKEMQLHLNMNNLKNWHQHHKNLAIQRQILDFKLKKQGVHV